MTIHVQPQNTEAAVLARIIQADQNEITTDVAWRLLSMQLPEADRNRADDLSAKVRCGSLTEGESAELDSATA
jgi:hypothetical protein